MVSPDLRSCTCGDPKEFGLPCRHVLAVYTSYPESRRGTLLHELCHPAFLVDSMAASWTFGVAVPDLGSLRLDPYTVPPDRRARRRKGEASSRSASAQEAAENRAYMLDLMAEVSVMDRRRKEGKAGWSQGFGGEGGGGGGMGGVCLAHMRAGSSSGGGGGAGAGGLHTLASDHSGSEADEELGLSITQGPLPQPYSQPNGPGVGRGQTMRLPQAGTVNPYVHRHA